MDGHQRRHAAYYPRALNFRSIFGVKRERYFFDCRPLGAAGGYSIVEVALVHNEIAFLYRRTYSTGPPGGWGWRLAVFSLCPQTKQCMCVNNIGLNRLFNCYQLVQFVCGWDRRVYEEYVGELFQSQLLLTPMISQQPLLPSGWFRMPRNGSYQTYVDFIGGQLPDSDGIDVFGQHENANIKYLKSRSDYMLQMLSRVAKDLDPGHREHHQKQRQRRQHPPHHRQHLELTHEHVSNERRGTAWHQNVSVVLPVCLLSVLFPLLCLTQSSLAEGRSTKCCCLCLRGDK